MTMTEIKGMGLDRPKRTLLANYSMAHMLVDAICVGGVLSLNTFSTMTTVQYTTTIVLYNVIAFGLQPFIGFFCDESQRDKTVALVGIGLVIISMAAFGMPWLLVGLAGVGNAMFHVGGGIASLSMTPGKAAGPGIFVAPGAVGVFLGGMFSGHLWPLIVEGVGLSILAVLLWRMDYQSELVYSEEKPVLENPILLAILALLTVIFFRALIAGGISFPWRITNLMKVVALLMVVGGKALGGIAGDRFGFRRIAVGGLILAAPMLMIGSGHWLSACIGLFAFNLTMPITLTALAGYFQKYKGFAFGLTTLALLLGYLMNELIKTYNQSLPQMTAIGIGLSILCLIYGLKKVVMT